MFIEIDAIDLATRPVATENPMTDDIRPVSQDQAGGAGRLAQVIATRGGLAAPEAPFVIEHREALIYMLCEAAELEHGIMCQYLFAAFSLVDCFSENAANRYWHMMPCSSSAASHSM